MNPLVRTTVSAVIAAAAVVAVTPTATAAPATVRGTVRSAGGPPADDAVIRLLELQRAIRADDAGAFVFADVPAGTYVLEAVSPLHGTAVRPIEVPDGALVEVQVIVESEMHRDEIVVTASPEPRTREEIVQPVDVVAGEELDLRLAPSLGDTLDSQPGVASSSFGAGAGRPVVRGLGDDRVRILQDGLDTGDVSASSPDHAVAVDPLSAERIEVLRGPATLLYGSGAIGGVVNVITERMPSTVPPRLTGAAELVLGSAADEASGSAEVEGGTGRLAWRAAGFTREGDDYEVPEHGGDAGVVENSWFSSDGADLGVAWIDDRGSIGIAVGGLDSRYGVPGHVHHGHDDGHDEHDEHSASALDEHENDHDHGHDDGVSIDLEQRRVDLRGVLRTPLPGVRELRLRLGGRDYRHTELEGRQVGTRFEREGWDLRLEALHGQLGPFTGAIGIEGSDFDFDAAGEEAFVPTNGSSRLALFVVEEVERGDWSFEIGARHEEVDVEADRLLGPLPDGSPLERSFSPSSLSAGAVWRPSDEWAVGLTATRAERAPGAVELFAGGPHAATRSYEIGDPTLGVESSLGWDLSLRHRAEWFSAEVTLFSNDFDDFVHAAFTGLEESGFDVLRWTQADASFVGAELTAEWSLIHREPYHLRLELVADWVDAELDDGSDLPRIPPLSAAAALHWHAGRFHGLGEVRWVDDATDVAAFESRTDGHTQVNLAAGYRFVTGPVVHDALLRIRNATDELARNHVSRLKEDAPMPGRDIGLVYRILF